MPAAIRRTFDRWFPPSDATMAHRRLRHDLTALNDYCWHSLGLFNDGEKRLAIHGGSSAISAVFDYGDDLGTRSTTPIPLARKQFRELENMGRLATIINVTSCLELYMRRIVRLSLQSDPGLLISKPRAVDGVSLLKSKQMPDVDRWVKACTEGEWQNRADTLAKLYATRLPIISENMADLEFVRRLRNSIAHDFARARSKDFWYLDPSQAEPLPLERLSASRLQKLLRLIGAVAEELDGVSVKHVGSYELLHFWHNFQIERLNPKTAAMKAYVGLYKNGAITRLLSGFRHRMGSGVLSREYCLDLIRHYDNA